MSFIKEMVEAEAILKKKGWTVFIPKGIELMRKSGWKLPDKHSEKVKDKIKHRFIKEHFQKIKKCDAILVLNYSKKNKKNYIGGNSFLEMGFAHVLGKKIYLLNPIPRCAYEVEIRSMQPTVLNDNLSGI